MIVPFWSWNLSDTTHVRSHTKFQLVWAINTAFTRGGLNQPPPSLKYGAGTPSLLGLNIFIYERFFNGNFHFHLKYIFLKTNIFMTINIFNCRGKTEADNEVVDVSCGSRHTVCLSKVTKDEDSCISS